jgi:hypothetical protein
VRTLFVFASCVSLPGFYHCGPESWEVGWWRMGGGQVEGEEDGVGCVLGKRVVVKVLSVF